MAYSIFYYISNSQAILLIYFFVNYFSMLGKQMLFLQWLHFIFSA